MQKQTEQNSFLPKFEASGKRISVRKKEIFIKQNQTSDTIGYVKEGAFKLVYKNDKKEWIKSFLFEGSILGSIPSILQKKPSTYSIIAIEPSEVFILPAKELITFFDTEIDYKTYMIQFLTNLYLKKEKRVADFLLLDANQRYKEMIAEYKQNLVRISQIDQSAYLGITNVALSRIKKNSFLNTPKSLSHTIQ
ncbi:cAMP-binding protein [Leptospira ellinghausenii]|uniref:cAMP-binding protein n=1 Tax=Leptospira ellinghausenii TaxID=1917822 RepID=A0A2P2DGE9_9LEPT|nr:Crp/Fnr family transcriptional regulator [Leptospira ellinghausenii]GBF43716.1 cAMP-binding protein [Leptospira ellinghausenii]